MKNKTTIKELEVNGETYVLKSAAQSDQKLTNRSIIRCRLAGVHVGTVVKEEGSFLVLEDCNRIWRWRGAHDLSYVAMDGVNRKEYTRISKLVPEMRIPIADIAEIIPVAEGVDLTECGEQVG